MNFCSLTQLKLELDVKGQAALLIALSTEMRHPDDGDNSARNGVCMKGDHFLHFVAVIVGGNNAFRSR